MNAANAVSLISGRLALAHLRLTATCDGLNTGVALP